MRFTVRWMMLVVLFAGRSMAAARVHPALGCITAAVSGLALVRTFEHLGRSPHKGVTRVIWTFLASVAISVTILSAAILPGLCLIPVIDPPQMHTSGDFGPPTVVGLVMAGLIVFPIAVILRWKCGRADALMPTIGLQRTGRRSAEAVEISDESRGFRRQPNLGIR